MSLLSGWINLQSAKRENLSIEFLENFLRFCYYMGVSELIKIKNNYDSVIKISYLTKFSKSTFILARDELENTLQPTFKIAKEFISHEDIPTEWYKSAKTIIDEYIQTNKKL